MPNKILKFYGIVGPKVSWIFNC